MPGRNRGGAAESRTGSGREPHAGGGQDADPTDQAAGGPAGREEKSLHGECRKHSARGYLLYWVM